MQDGNLAFPDLEQLGLHDIFDDDVWQTQNHLLQTLRMRADDPDTRRIGYLRIDSDLVKDSRFQDELERYVPSLVVS